MKFLKVTAYVCLISLIFSGFKCKENICPNCDIEPDGGPCKASFSRYYFDKTEGKCLEFIWGGCDGSVPFETLEACEACKCDE